jgi:orotate phosphoribosyltransferase
MSTTVDHFEQLLKQVGAWQSGHFLLASGLHSSEYMQCQKLLQYPRYGIMFAQAMVRQVLEAGIRPTTVVGPALGAVHLEVLAALALDAALEEKEPARGIFAERPEGKFEIRRGTELKPGERVLVVEDVTTTGGSARDVVTLVRSLGAEPVAVGTIIDRSAGAAKFDVPFFPLLKVTMSAHKPEECPLCQAGKPLVKLGSTKKPAGA